MVCAHTVTTLPHLNECQELDLGYGNYDWQLSQHFEWLH